MATNEKQRKVRVRFAPSPTGPLHMGGVRTALYNYLFARQQGGDFLLRIEDTDQNRFVPGAEEYIVEALRWCGIPPDEGFSAGGRHAPYRQSERKEIYKDYALRLVASGHAYYAFDTPQELEDMREKLKAAGIASPQYNVISRESMQNSLTMSHDEVERRLASGEPHVIRIKIPRKEEVRVIDLIRGIVLVHTAQMDDKVLFKSDGMPTYHLANVVDDHLMEITHVIRGEEWLPSAPLHILLYKYFGWEETMPFFAHLPLLLKPDGNGKLSKRDGDRLGFPVFPLVWTDPFTGELSSGYRERGFFPEAFVNMLAMLGWNPGSNQEIFSMDEMIGAFSIDRISRSGAKFDYQKALWFNQHYLRERSDEELAIQFMAVIESNGVSAQLNYITTCCALIKEKAQLISQFWDLGWFFFKDPETYEEEVIQKKWNSTAARFFQELYDRLPDEQNLGSTELELLFNTVAASKNLKGPSFMQLFRVIVTGSSHGPAMFEVAAVLGTQALLRRLGTALRVLELLPE